MQCAKPGCKAHVMKDCDYCFFHNPDRPKPTPRRKATQIEIPSTLGEMAVFMARLAVDVASGKVSPKDSEAIKCIAALAIRAMEADQLSARVDELQKESNGN